MSLAPCPSCSRHVRINEKTCPFCKGDLPEGMTAIPGATHRMTRAAAYAFTATLAVAGCTTGQTTITGGDGSVDDSGGPSDGGTTDGAKKDANTPPDEGGVQPPYGAPAYGAPPFDSGTD